MILEAQAPTRVDFAGGTLDIHPLYLLEEDAWTVSAAIDVPVRARVAPNRSGYTIVSRDLGVRADAPSLEALPTGGPLDLAVRALRFAAPPEALAVTLESSAPPGSGLGASSALLVALLAVLDRWMQRRRDPQELVAAAWRLEAQSLRTLTGRQDYLAAVHGGVNAIGFGPAGDTVQPLVRDAALRRALQQRLVVVYTGRPHSSGLTNWGVVRAYLDGVAATVGHLAAIAGVARRLRDALAAGDLEALAPLVAEEWSHRRELAPGVETPLIRRAAGIALRHGGLAAKACGAGGGGCVLVVVRPGAKRHCETALREAGFATVSARIVPAGLRIRRLD